jgi:hypothetical protein
METPGSKPAAAAMAGTTQATDDPAADAADTAATADTAAARPVWRFLFEPRWLGWHVLVVVAFWGMLWLGDWQFHRAMQGNGLSWAYTFEWPLFAGFAVVFWARTIRDEFRLRGGVPPVDETETGPVLPEGIGVRAIERPDDDADDTELARYNAYLQRLNAEVKGKGSRFPR